MSFVAILMRSRLLLVLLGLTTLAAALAGVLPVANGSFEEPALGREGQQTTNLIEGWKAEGIAGVFVNNGAFGNKMAEAGGEQMVWINGTKAGSIAQVVAPRTEALTVYSATVAVGLRKDTPLTNGASLLIGLQAFDEATAKVGRTLV